MEPNKILSASILDLVFDDRNKEYGAYELRKTYSQRIKKALLITAIIAVFAFGGAIMANSIKPDKKPDLDIKTVVIQALPDEEVVPIPPPEEKRPEPEPVQTEKFIDAFKIVAEDVDPPPTQDDLKNSIIDVFDQKGKDAENIIMPPGDMDKGKGIIEPPKNINDGPVTIVEIDAKFTGNWEKFLLQNLDPSVPVDKGASVGTYRVIIQFVVDLEGNVSDIKPLTSFGYGMEEEAIRVLKRAKKWEPAVQNGYKVKAYRKQPVTFVVE